MSEYDSTLVLVFEPTIILKHRQKDWNQYHHLGECYLPQVALKELEFLTNRAVLPEEEKSAREFIRFFPYSGWHIHEGLSSHQTFVRTEGENMSKKARLQYSIAQSVYDLSIQHPAKLVILVTNEQNLRNNLAQTQTKNLISITLAQLNHWLRTQQKPAFVIEAIEQLTNFTTHKTTQAADYSLNIKAQSRKNLSSKTTRKTITKPKKIVLLSGFNDLSRFVLGILTLCISLSLTGILVWFLINPQSFKQFLKQNKFSYLETIHDS